MDYLITLTSPVLINGYVSDIINRRPNAVKELLVKSIEKKNIAILKAVIENSDHDYILSLNIRLLLLAVKNSFPEAVELLLKCGMGCANELDSSGRSALTVAIVNNASECVAKLLDEGANPNNGGSGPPPLIAAAQANDTNAMRKLIQMNAKIDAVDDQGRTPLFYAAKSAIGVSILLEAGASTDVTDSSSGSTPLMVACVEGFDRAVELMARKCKNPNIADRFGHTALTYSAIQGHTGSVKTLLSIGASVDMLDINRMSIIALTVLHNQLGSLITLLQESPVYPVSTSKVASPLGVALRNENFAHAVALIYAGIDRHYLGPLLEDYFLDRIEGQEQPSTSNQWLILTQYAQNGPLSLQIYCRNAIRKQLGRNILLKVKSLELPPCLLDFLTLKHLEYLLSTPPEAILSFI